MKKIINGRRYDTDTATAVANYDNGMAINDFRYYEETLYRKTTGEYFLYVIGGAATSYAVRDGELVSGGKKIIPLAYDEAQSWAEKHLDCDAYEAIFGVIQDDGEKRQIALSLPISTIEVLKRLAAKKDQGISDVINDLIITNSK